MVVALLPCETRILKGNVFTSVCQSFCSRGRRSLSGGLCLRRSLSVQGVSVQGGYLSRGFSVQGVSVQGSLSGGSLSWGSLSRGISVQGSLCPGYSMSVQGVSVCQGDPQTETPYDEERAVRILLECILVYTRVKVIFSLMLVASAVVPLM